MPLHACRSVRGPSPAPHAGGPRGGACCRPPASHAPPARPAAAPAEERVQKRNINILYTERRGTPLEGRMRV